jgi:hypothetical protein
LLSALERLAEPVECLTGRRRVTTPDGARRVGEGRLRVGACLSGGRVELRELACQRVALGRSHAAEPVLQRVEVLVGLLRLAVRIAVAARRGAAQAP